jgi:MYXO-CTERM domain-containing protein
MRAAALVAFLVASTATAHAQLELRNDGFVDNASVGFQGGFVAGEIGASRFIAPSAGRTLQHVRLLFGGAAGTRTITLHVYDDSAGATAPGAELFSGDYQLTASNSAMQDIDLTGDNIVVTAQFRIGIEFQHAGLPSIARDDDGTIAAALNYIFVDAGIWFRSQPLGLTGDWIIRAVVSDSTPTIDAGIDAPTGPDAGAQIDAFTPGDAPGDSGTTPDAPMAGECQGNGDCAIGSYCNPATQACTFDCRTADDCGGDTCNSLGQCVMGTGDDGGGCCSTGDGGVAGALGLGGAVALLLSRRRRRR